MDKRTVLIVEDQSINRKVLVKLLESDYDLLEAANGKEAVDILYKNADTVSVVLLDILMPVMDGYEVLDKMRKDSVLSKIPVIVLSQKDDDTAEVQALELGAQDYVTKPYNADIIKHRLNNTIKLRETAAIVNRIERDELTGLYNKHFFIEKVSEELKNHPEKNYDLLCLGVERLKLINDTFGVKKGDELLRYIARLMKQVCNGKNICGRFEADIFYMLIEHKAEYTDEMFAHWIDSVNDFSIDMRVKMHCGIYIINDSSQTVDSMCDWALLASENNKGKYDAAFSMYDEKIREKLFKEQFITGAMQESLHRRQFKVYYQPKYDMHTERVVGAEALVRWVHPEKGMMSPGDFIPIFEKNGFITQLDQYVWETACKDMRSWIDKGYPAAAVSVNVSRADIYNPHLFDIITGLVEQYNIPVSFLHLEITESAYTENPMQIIEVVDRLREYGFIIEMDDFGSGYSSLNMLAKMPVDILKLDMKFIQNSSGRNILSFVISLAKWMNLYVVAEGVETSEQIIMLLSMDCNCVQGFYYARPMPIDEFENLLVTNAVESITQINDVVGIQKVENQSFPDRKKNRIMLIVDDTEENRDVLTGVFFDEFTIVEKENGKLALDYLEQHYDEIDIVLLDLMMPVLDGIELLSRMNKDARMNHIPVVVTSQGNPEAEKKALEIRADDFLCKPYNPVIVKQRIHNVILSHKAKNNDAQNAEQQKNTGKDIWDNCDSAVSAQEQNRYRYILDNLDVAFFEIDEKGSFYASDKFSLYAMSDNNVSNILSDTGAYQVIYPDDLPVLFRFMNEKRKLLPKVSEILRMKMKDGTYRWTEIIGFFEYDESGDLKKTIGVLRDMDKEWLRQNRKLQEALNSAETANRAKTDFLARVSHDMRTPLNGILGICAIMKDKAKETELQDDLLQLEDSGKYLLNLINDTLDVSKIENGDMELHPSVCDGEALLKTVIAMVRPNLEEKRIQFEVHAEDGTSKKLYIDCVRVQQVVMNILGNAVKFTNEGGRIDLFIENISCDPEVIMDKIVIRDTGIGMSKEFQQFLFLPFTQEHNDSRSIYRGTGLGMTITKQCLELMGGSISIQSEEGRGTEVTMIIPMPVATKEQIESHRREADNEISDSLLSGKHVLLCEDHPLNAAIAVKLLERKGMIVEIAENGKIGLDKFNASPLDYYDVILMDIRMPVMDGLEATREIRKLSRKDALDVPIIAMTANAMTEDVNNSIDAGMSEHLGKPIEPNRLYYTIAEYIRAPHPHLGKKVLVVDDIDMNRGMVRKAISSLYRVFEARNGEEALEILHKEQDIAAVITDVQMPGMDGKELIAQIRKDKHYRNLAILANTIYGDHRQEDELLNAGANDFVYKPASPRVILMRLEHILRNI